MVLRLISLLLLLSLSFLPRTAAAIAPSTVTVLENQAVLRFPERITFRARFESTSPIATVTLEYGSEQLTCGEVVAKAFPQFRPGPQVAVEWTWDMRQSGSLPPGETIWWRWRLVDSTGQETLIEQQTVTWLDSQYAWRTLTRSDIALHWYSGDQAFAETLLNAAEQGLKRLEADAGIRLESRVDIYIYANTFDLRQAILYEPSWTGGVAFPENGIVIIGIAPNQLEWGLDTIVHELSHVVIGAVTFSCLGDLPTWLSEGLAVYSEGDLDPASQAQLDRAIRNDTLLSVRSLSGPFSEVPDRAYLSYSQSYSIVRFLIETYGQEKMNALLATLRDGQSLDAALLQTYGFDVDGLEREWRAAIGAKPPVALARPTAQPTPTVVPTIVPISGFIPPITPTPFLIPSPAPVLPSPEATQEAPLAPAGASIVRMAVLLFAVCFSAVFLIGIVVLGVILHMQKQKGGSP